MTGAAPKQENGINAITHRSLYTNFYVLSKLSSSDFESGAVSERITLNLNLKN